MKSFPCLPVPGNRSSDCIWLIHKTQLHHSKLRPFSIKFQVPATKPTQAWSACFKDSKNVLHEILENKAWRGRANLHGQFCPILANQPELVMLPRRAFLCPIYYDFMQCILESLKQTNQPLVGFVSGTWNFIKNCLSLLWYCTSLIAGKKSPFIHADTEIYEIVIFCLIEVVKSRGKINFCTSHPANLGRVAGAYQLVAQTNIGKNFSFVFQFYPTE